MTDRVWRVSSGVAFVQSPDGGRVALLHLEQDVPVILAGTAASIWNALDGTKTETELVEELAGAYGSEASAIHADVIGLIRSLSNSGMITLSYRDGVAY